MATPESEALLIIGKESNPKGICFDPTLYKSSGLTEIARHQVFSLGSEITIVGKDKTIKYDAFELLEIRTLHSTERRKKINEISKNMGNGAWEVIISSAKTTKPESHQVIFSKDYPREFINSLEEIDVI